MYNYENVTETLCDTARCELCGALSAIPRVSGVYGTDLPKGKVPTSASPDKACGRSCSYLARLNPVRPRSTRHRSTELLDLLGFAVPKVATHVVEP